MATFQYLRTGAKNHMFQNFGMRSHPCLCGSKLMEFGHILVFVDQKTFERTWMYLFHVLAFFSLFALQLVRVPSEGAACSSNCNTCSGSSDYCTSCRTGYFLTAATCYACSADCSTCTSPSLCIQCDYGFYLSGRFCVSTCPTGFYGASGVCSACSSNCLTCSGGASYCTTCQTGYFLSSGYCYACSSNCLTCSGASFCTTCQTGYLLSSGYCYACSSNCLTCSGGASFCTTCQTGYLLSSGYCSGIQPNPSQKKDCPDNCLDCSSSSLCSICKNGYFKSSLNGQCINKGVFAVIPLVIMALAAVGYFVWKKQSTKKPKQDAVGIFFPQTATAPPGTPNQGAKQLELAPQEEDLLTHSLPPQAESKLEVSDTKVKSLPDKYDIEPA